MNTVIVNLLRAVPDSTGDCVDYDTARAVVRLDSAGRIIGADWASNGSSIHITPAIRKSIRAQIGRPHGFKINNNVVSYLSRRLANEEPAFADFFEFRGAK